MRHRGTRTACPARKHSARTTTVVAVAYGLPVELAEELDRQEGLVRMLEALVHDATQHLAAQRDMPRNHAAVRQAETGLAYQQVRLEAALFRVNTLNTIYLTYPRRTDAELVALYKQRTSGTTT